MTTKILPGAMQLLFEELERRGEIRKTGEYRKGRPVYVPTVKRTKGLSDLDEIRELVKALMDETEQMQEANPVPDDHDGRRLYILEMLAEIAEHHEIPIAPNEIEQHVELTLERLPDGTWAQRFCPLTDAGDALMDVFEEEGRQCHQAEAEGRKLVTRPWSWKLNSRQ